MVEKSNLDDLSAGDMNEEHPIAYELRRLRTIEKVSEGTGNTVVFDLGISMGEGLTNLIRENRAKRQ